MADALPALGAFRSVRMRFESSVRRTVGNGYCGRRETGSGPGHPPPF
jgi:hypothetical protein